MGVPVFQNHTEGCEKMISVPKKVEELIRKSAYQSVSIRVEPLKGEPFYITSQDIEEGSFTIQRDCISVNELEIGNMTAR